MSHNHNRRCYLRIRRLHSREVNKIHRLPSFTSLFARPSRLRPMTRLKRRVGNGAVVDRVAVVVTVGSVVRATVGEGKAGKVEMRVVVLGVSFARGRFW
jgi:hypothetical protein